MPIRDRSERNTHLWHWPIIVYSKMFFNFSAGTRELVIVALTFGLAVASRYLIEIPFRYKLSALRSGGIVTASAAALVILGCSTFYVSHYQNHSGHFSDDALTLAKFSQYHGTDEYYYQFRTGSCFIDGNDASKGTYQREQCLKTSTTGRNYLLIGDSHGAHLWRSLSTAAGEQVNLIQATAAGCKPVIGQTFSNKCTELMNYIYTEWLPHHKLDGVIISARWLPQDMALLQTTLTRLKSVASNIVVMGPTIEYSEALPDLLAYQHDGRTDLVAHSVDQQIKGMDQRLQRLVSQQQVRYISVYNIVCPQDRCHALASNGEPSAFDYGHFTLSGADDVARQAIVQMHRDIFM
ncbi:SGNH hydrolase domain-containing protein [Erwinia sp. V71]|uniref:SGNH hydrolase domain-containing protein n=1 Tax=Erwinia sp. V71 TaxID=3369424 RepID=UPI003F63E44A